MSLLTDHEDDISLMQNLSEIKKSNKFCKMMVTGEKQLVCDELHDKVITGKINFEDYKATMRARFHNNKKLSKVLTVVFK